MLCVRGVRSRKALRAPILSCFFVLFPAWRGREAAQSCSAQEWGQGVVGGLCRMVARNAECSTCFSRRLCAGDAQKGPVSSGRRKRYICMPVSHERRRATGDLAEGDGWGWRQHSHLQCDERPKDSGGLRRPRELCPQRVTSLGHLTSWSYPPRWRMLQVHLQHVPFRGSHRQDVSQGLR